MKTSEDIANRVEQITADRIREIRHSRKLVLRIGTPKNLLPRRKVANTRLVLLGIPDKPRDIYLIAIFFFLLHFSIINVKPTCPHFLTPPPPHPPALRLG